jgi:hypothetical protein
VSTSFARRIFGSLLAGLALSFAVDVSAAESNDHWLARYWQTDDGLPDNSVAGGVTVLP